MSTEQAFLDDIIAHPDDDVPRLVFADWLDDQGESERAEFIRLQCRLATLNDSDPERAALRMREDDLLDEYGARWAGPLRNLASQWLFRRGFLEAVEVTVTATQRIRTLLDNAPVRSLRLVTRGEELPGVLAAGPCLRRVRALALVLRTPVRSSELSELFRPGAMEDLASLLVQCPSPLYVPLRELAALVRPGTLPRLQELGLSVGEDVGLLDDNFLRALAEANHLTRLRRLHLPRAAFTQTLAHALSRSAAFAGLAHLQLGGGRATEATWRELLWPPGLNRLRWLGLGEAEVEQSGALLPLADTSLAQAIRKRFFPGRVEFDDIPPHLPYWYGRRP
jgi:uncharacterized protein (TIGR02996 family)